MARGRSRRPHHTTLSHGPPASLSRTRHPPAKRAAARPRAAEERPPGGAVGRCPGSGPGRNGSTRALVPEASCSMGVDCQCRTWPWNRHGTPVFAARRRNAYHADPFLVGSNTAAQSPEGVNPCPGQIEVNGIPMSYVDDGSGEPVVFVHGAVSDPRAWEPIRAAIADKHRFIAPTLRYFGANEWLDKGEAVRRRYARRRSRRVHQSAGCRAGAFGWLVLWGQRSHGRRAGEPRPRPKPDPLRACPLLAGQGRRGGRRGARGGGQDVWSRYRSGGGRRRRKGHQAPHRRRVPFDHRRASTASRRKFGQCN